MTKDKGAKTQQPVGAGQEDKGPRTREGNAGQPGGAGDPSHDSPKPHGDKLEQARDAAAGRGKAKS